MSDATMSLGQLQAIMALAEQKGLNPERTKLILSSGVLADVFDLKADLSNREAVQKVLGLSTSLVEPIVLTIDYSRNLDEMIAAVRLDSIGESFKGKRFLIDGKGRMELEAKLFHFNRSIGSHEAERLMMAHDRTNPWEQAKIEHLMAYGEIFPDEQKMYPIAGLGTISVEKKDRSGCVAVLNWSRGSGRCLHAHALDYSYGFEDNTRFLIVRKKISITESELQTNNL
jgi:hypothetical protein